MTTPLNKTENVQYGYISNPGGGVTFYRIHPPKQQQNGIPSIFDTLHRLECEPTTTGITILGLNLNTVQNNNDDTIDDDDDVQSSAESDSSSNPLPTSLNVASVVSTPIVPLKHKLAPIAASRLPDNIPLILRLDPRTPHPAVTNPRSIVKKVKDRLKRGPSDKDGPGYLYMFQLKPDATDHYYKIGRTSRFPELRIGEWPGAIVLKTWRVKRHKHAEAIVHWMMDVARVYRYVVAKDKTTKKETYLTVNKNTKAMITDATYKSRKKLGESLSIVGKTKRIEWFLISREIVDLIVTKTVQDINDHWKSEKWPTNMEYMK